jgi:hypothetical protein
MQTSKYLGVLNAFLFKAETTAANGVIFMYII